MAFFADLDPMDSELYIAKMKGVLAYLLDTETSDGTL